MQRKAKNNLFLWLLLFLTLPFRQASAEEINVKELVYEHLGDSYEWHIATWGDKELALPLPVILYSHNEGWQIFSSSRLAHGQCYRGFRIATAGAYSGKIVEATKDGTWSRPKLDISLTKNAAGLLVNSCLLLLIILPLARHYSKQKITPPGGFRGIIEVVLLYIDDNVIRPCIGEEYRRFSSYLLTVFFFILLNNLMGLVPFFPAGANLTGNIAVTFILAFTTFLVVNLNGSREYWQEILWPDVPAWLKVPVPLMPLIELFGIFTKPFALMIRLFANIMAGHAVILGLVSLIFIAATMGAAISTGMTFLSVIFTLFMNCVELLVAFIQAYVFTLLSAVFIGSARVKHKK